MAVKVFFSYTHTDEALRDQLARHLAMMKRQGLIEDWHDRRIDAGEKIDPVIRHALEGADIILCLASPDFFASNYCYDIEMSRALERCRAGECVVIPVILRPCDWKHSPLAALRATPTDGKPITNFANPDEAFQEVTQDIRRVARGLEERRRTPAAPVAPAVEAPPIPTPIASAQSSGPTRPRLRRKFTDEMRDEFLERAFRTIATTIEHKLGALESDSHLKGKFQQVDAQTFQGTVYEDGERAAAATIWYDAGAGFGGRGIYYAGALQAGRNSYNEWLTLEDDGYELRLKPIGMAMTGRRDEKLSPEQAAEYLWDVIMQRFTQ